MEADRCVCGHTIIVHPDGGACQLIHGCPKQCHSFFSAAEAHRLGLMSSGVLDPTPKSLDEVRAKYAAVEE